MTESKEESISLYEIKKRIKTSFITLSARQIALRAIGFISINIILARILPIETLGVFNIATAIITFFAFFSDVGLAASLIQKKDEVKFEDIKTTFTIQQILVGVLSLIIILGAPFFANTYNLGSDGVWLIRILGAAFFLSSLKVIPSVILERNLNFSPIVVVEIVETLIFNGVLITLAFNNFGLWSFSAAAISRGLIGVALIYILAPTKLGVGIHRESANNLLKFGIPFQINSLLALVKDRLVPLVVASMIGPVGMGLVTWSQALAFLPLELMQVVIRITFPAFSRLQEDKVSLKLAVEKSLFLTALFVYPALFGLAAILPSVVNYVVSQKWQPALLSFYLFSFSTFWAVISTTFTNLLNAVGQIKTTLKLMTFWTVLTWLLTPTLVYFYDFVGVAVASSIISFTSVLTIILVKRFLNVGVLDAIILPILASAAMAVFIYTLSKVFIRDWFTLIVSILLGVVFYLGIIYLFGRKRILADLESLRHV